MWKEDEIALDIHNPRIHAMGHVTPEDMKLILAEMLAKSIDVVGPEFADASVTDDWVLSFIPGIVIETEYSEEELAVIASGRQLGKCELSSDILKYLHECPEPLECRDESYDDGHQHWRGGSRGKGGKIKYRRT